jgi:hypothetical protein
MKKYFYQIVSILTFSLLISCENVSEGYEVEYGGTSAKFLVSLTTPNIGSEGDESFFSLQAQSDNEIKSIVVSYYDEDQVGANTGYVVDSSITDPLLNHALGTIKPGTYSVDLGYKFVFPSDSAKNTIKFTLIDEEGKAEVEFDLKGIPNITRYDNVILVSQNPVLLDGLSSADGEVYTNLAEYKDLSATNLLVQEKIDINFGVNSNLTAKIFSPYNNSFGLGFSKKNKTVFKLLNDVTISELDTINNIGVSKITEANKVDKGATVIESVKVGDIIGFRTDFASANPYHYGILKINAIHPTNVERYDGASYLIEMDVIVQK